MDIKDYIRYIKNEIKDKQNYDEYVHAFEEYKRYLEEHLKWNSNDIEAICQYSVVLYELRMEEDVIVDLMEKILINRVDQLTPMEKLRLHINIAAIYESGEKCIYHLEEAVKLNLPIANSYDALAKEYFDEKKYNEAELLFMKATEVSQKAIYHYNYAVSLYLNNKIEQARLLIKELIKHMSYDWQPIYGYAVACWYSNMKGEFYETLSILENLDETEFNFDKDLLADLYFVCGKYQEHNSIYDNSEFGYSISSSWVFPYLYSLKHQGEMTLLEEKYHMFLSDIQQDIIEYMNEALSDPEDFHTLIEEKQKEADELIDFYKSLCETNYKPMVVPRLYCIYECYMLDCPRHQELN